MPIYDRAEVGRTAKEYGFVRDTFEKVLRLTEILKFINADDFFNSHLVLKGGTAINLTVFDLPRLSVDIDFDYTPNQPLEIMLETRQTITRQLRHYLEMEAMAWNASALRRMSSADRHFPDRKGVRMYVYVNDDDGTIYNVEMQTGNDGNLAKQARYYQGTNDLDRLLGARAKSWPWGQMFARMHLLRPALGRPCKTMAAGTKVCAEALTPAGSWALTQNRGRGDRCLRQCTMRQENR